MLVEALARAPEVARLAMTVHDRTILALARSKLGLGNHAFSDAVRALREAVEETIPSGRIFLLGAGERGPIIGSRVSGVGIVEADDCIRVVRVVDGRSQRLGRLQ